jgi:hypothetical protein
MASAFPRNGGTQLDWTSLREWLGASGGFLGGVAAIVSAAYARKALKSAVDAQQASTDIQDLHRKDVEERLRQSQSESRERQQELSLLAELFELKKLVNLNSEEKRWAAVRLLQKGIVFMRPDGQTFWAGLRRNDGRD